MDLVNIALHSKNNETIDIYRKEAQNSWTITELRHILKNVSTEEEK